MYIGLETLVRQIVSYRDKNPNVRGFIEENIHVEEGDNFYAELAV